MVVSIGCDPDGAMEVEAAAAVEAARAADTDVAAAERPGGSFFLSCSSSISSS